MIDKPRLEAKCSTWNITLTGTQLDQLDAFAQILVDYNQKVNLTAITDPEGIEDKHFLDSLLFASQPEVAGKMVDVGAGAGFPGIVTKIYKPELELTLMEPTGKRVDFLKYLCGELGLTGVEFAKERAEEAARKIWREQFDVASARAVAALPVQPDCALVDGNRAPDLPLEVRTIIKGDAQTASIAAASILAKVSRDRYMLQMAEKYPQYAFEKHKGYGTKLHYERLEQYGISPIHRLSFLKKWMNR